MPVRDLAQPLDRAVGARDDCGDPAFFGFRIGQKAPTDAHAIPPASARLTAGETAAMLVAATMREAKAHLPPAGSVVGDVDVSHP